MFPPDWSQPWWQDWRAWVEPVWSEWHRRAGPHAVDSAVLPEVLNRHTPASPVRFVPQLALPEGQSYEGFIFQHQQVPTRDNLHDLFNGCCWRRFPRTKARLNVLQGEAIDRDGVGARRGPLRDALTLFDENVLLLQVPTSLWEALRRHDWATVLVRHRHDWCPAGLTPGQDRAPSDVFSGSQNMSAMAPPSRKFPIRPVVFGHALLEKLCRPYKSVTAHAFWVDPALPPTDAAWDDWLARRLEASFMATKPFQPLPVMGIPGWCEDNAHPSFYEDAQVFRPMNFQGRQRG
jgi:hypothetical protein